jgi:hypothetical protein
MTEMLAAAREKRRRRVLCATASSARSKKKVGSERAFAAVQKLAAPSGLHRARHLCCDGIAARFSSGSQSLRKLELE